ncbi:hypothetical protein KKG61_02775 [bacterium]|nr:hypothetical protein [bacterium]MBU1599021.1 hypothetical protein [bacterium]
MRKIVVVLIVGGVLYGLGRDEIYNKSPMKVTLKELFESADCVVMGKIEKVKAEKEIELLPVEVVKKRLSMEEEETGEKRMHLLEERRKREMVYTHVKLSPDEWLKNEGKEKEILIQVMGGESEPDEKGVRLAVMVNHIGGTPVFKENQRVLVFLEKAEGKPYYWMVCNARGEYVIEKNKIINQLLGEKESLKGFLDKIKRIKNEGVKEK